MGPLPVLRGWVDYSSESDEIVEAGDAGDAGAVSDTHGADRSGDTNNSDSSSSRLISRSKKLREMFDEEIFDAYIFSQEYADIC